MDVGTRVRVARTRPGFGMYLGMQGVVSSAPSPDGRVTVELDQRHSECLGAVWTPPPHWADLADLEPVT